MNYNSYFSPMDPISISFYGSAKKNQSVQSTDKGKKYI